MTGWRARRAPARPAREPAEGGRTRLRPMVAADLTDVLALEHELFPDDPWTARMFAEELAQPPGSRLYLVAETSAADGGGAAISGYAGMMFVPTEEFRAPWGSRASQESQVSRASQADVLTIAVARDCWGRGTGSALLGALLRAARDRGCAEVFLEVREDNPRARGLYLRRGFEEIGTRRGYYQPSGVDAIVMRKDMRS